jgi:hypothetical protein
VRFTHDGRSLIYTAEYPVMNELLALPPSGMKQPQQSHPVLWPPIPKAVIPGGGRSLTAPLWAIPQIHRFGWLAGWGSPRRLCRKMLRNGCV